MSITAWTLWFSAALVAAGTAGPAPGTLDYRVDLQLGGDDEEVFFGTVSAVAEDSAGHIYVADQKQSVVLKFSPAGEFEGRLGQAGSGPGTIMPWFCLAIGPGDEIHLAGIGRRIEVVDTDWRYLRTIERINPGSIPLGMAMAPGGAFAVAAAGQSTCTTVDLYGSGGVYSRSISPAFSFNKGYLPRIEQPFVGGHVAVSSAGTLYFAQMSPFLIRAFDWAGAQLDSTSAGGAEFVGYPKEPEIRGDSVTYGHLISANGIVVLESGLVVVTAGNARSSEEGETLFCAYSEALEFRGSRTEPTLSRIVGVGSGNRAYLVRKGEAGTMVLRVAFSVGDP